jgi:hypothetical protein
MFTALAFAKKNGVPPAGTDAVATITQMENASVKADIAGDSMSRRTMRTALAADRAGETGKLNSRSWPT